MSNIIGLVDFYVKTKIRTLYKNFDNAHNTNHFDEVYKLAVKFAHADKLDEADMLIVMIAAAYHDTGLSVNRDEHERFSQNILRCDKHLFADLTFNGYSHPEQQAYIIDNACRAINNHRSKHRSTNEFDQIIKDADSASLLDKQRTLNRVCSFYMDNLYKETDSLDEIVANRLNYLNTKIQTKMDTKFKSNAANKLGIRPKWRVSDVTEKEIIDILHKINPKL